MSKLRLRALNPINVSTHAVHYNANKRMLNISWKHQHYIKTILLAKANHVFMFSNFNTFAEIDLTNTIFVYRKLNCINFKYINKTAIAIGNKNKNIFLKSIFVGNSLQLFVCAVKNLTYARNNNLSQKIFQKYVSDDDEDNIKFNDVKFENIINL